MSKIITSKQAIKISKGLRSDAKKLVLAGGCFDILHLGHIRFLQKAKETGDILLVWLEADETIKQRKGDTRPIHIQKDRAEVLAALSCVDYVLLVPVIQSNNEYDALVTKIQPAIIATTKGDPGLAHKERQAKNIHAKVLSIIKRLPTHSSSRLALFE